MDSKHTTFIYRQHISHFVLVIFLVLYSAVVSSATQLTYQVIKTVKHDPSIFTQGLVLQDNWLIESSGLYGKSFITIYHAESSAPRAKKMLPGNHFAEGITYVDGKLFVLTWKAGVLYILDGKSLKDLGSLTYQGEGWGLTFDGNHLIMSDGSDSIFFRDLEKFSIKNKILVHNGKRSIRYLNELEYAHNMIWANVWQSKKILRIDPESGVVNGILDLSDLVDQNSRQPMTDVLNGIAYDQQSDSFWVTGKLWPNRYLIKIQDQKK